MKATFKLDMSNRIRSSKALGDGLQNTIREDTKFLQGIRKSFFDSENRKRRVEPRELRIVLAPVN
jgi:hypothetical protein